MFRTAGMPLMLGRENFGQKNGATRLKINALTVLTLCYRTELNLVKMCAESS
jgi:hypothetical protein